MTFEEWWKERMPSDDDRACFAAEAFKAGRESMKAEALKKTGPCSCSFAPCPHDGVREDIEGIEP